MKSFLVTYEQRQPELSTLELFKAHVAYIKKLYTSGYITLCGPFVEKTGAVLIFAADSELQVKNLVEQDPFITKKYFAHFTVREFISASDANNWLLPQNN